MLGALPADDRRHVLEQLVGDRKQGDAAVRGQPLVPAADERISRPRAHAHRHRSRHLRDVDDHPRPDRMRTPNDLTDVDQRPGRELDGAETDRGGATVNAVQQGSREILCRSVLDPLDHHADPLARNKPRVGDAGKIGRHQDDLAARLRGQARELTECGASNNPAAATRRSSRIPSSAMSESLTLPY